MINISNLLNLSYYQVIIISAVAAIIIICLLFIHRALRYRRMMKQIDADMTSKEEIYFQSYFLRPASPLIGKRKSIVVNSDHHALLKAISKAAGMKEITILSYVERILEHHFSYFQDDINKLNINQDDHR